MSISPRPFIASSSVLSTQVDVDRAVGRDRRLGALHGPLGRQLGGRIATRGLAVALGHDGAHGHRVAPGLAAVRGPDEVDGGLGRGRHEGRELAQPEHLVHRLEVRVRDIDDVLGGVLGGSGPTAIQGLSRKPMVRSPRRRPNRSGVRPLVLTRAAGGRDVHRPAVATVVGAGHRDARHVLGDRDGADREVLLADGDAGHVHRARRVERQRRVAARELVVQHVRRLERAIPGLATVIRDVRRHRREVVVDGAQHDVLGIGRVDGDVGLGLVRPRAEVTRDEVVGAERRGRVAVGHERARAGRLEHRGRRVRRPPGRHRAVTSRCPWARPRRVRRSSAAPSPGSSATPVPTGGTRWARGGRSCWRAAG